MIMYTPDQGCFCSVGAKYCEVQHLGTPEPQGTPGTGLKSPDSASSPRHSQCARQSAGICPLATNAQRDRQIETSALGGIGRGEIDGDTFSRLEDPDGRVQSAASPRSRAAPAVSGKPTRGQTGRTVGQMRLNRNWWRQTFAAVDISQGRT
jgi:hypothetical protein